MSVSPARRVALRVLGRIRRDDAFSGAVLSAELGRTNLAPDDVALATHLVNGVLAASGVLDEVIDSHATGSLEPRVRDALRLGTYEALFGRAPAYAVVDQTVEAVRRVRPRAAGLANAVMRRVTERAAEFPWGDPETDRVALARATAHPRWIVDLTLEALGEARGREALRSGTGPAPSYVRIDPFAVAREVTLGKLEEADPVPSPPDPDCYVLGRPAAAFGSGDLAGWFAMDAAAQMAPRACAPAPGLRIADVGAGRGNKTLCLQSLAMRSGGSAAITAVELHPGKCTALQSRLAASGVPGVEVVCADARDLPAVFGPGAFDVVLLDAPCTGLGTLRRYPEKRWRLMPEDIARMADTQRALIAAAAAVAMPGGCVVYSTCSIARDENGGVVESFLGTEEGSHFAVESLETLVPPEWTQFVTAEGYFQSWPAAGGPDGHFVAVLRRTEDDRDRREEGSCGAHR